MTSYKKLVVINKFKGFLPEISDFELILGSLPELKENEFLVKAEYISVDPYMIIFADGKQVPYDQYGFQLGNVIESRNADYPKDTDVVSHSPWSTHVILDGKPDPWLGVIPYKPPIGNLSRSLAIGTLGMPGITAYLGFLNICTPSPGYVVCITSAAGAVGSIVGQIAKLKDCVVIGFTGSDTKVKYLVEELGFHFAFNYKTEKDIKGQIKKIAPKGVNCFFDNVGGSLANLILECMANGGKVASCGSISTYGGPAQILRKPKNVTIEIQDFTFTQWDWNEQLNAIDQLKTLIENKHIKTKETVTEYFENLPMALIGMLRGDGIGKCLVKVESTE